MSKILSDDVVRNLATARSYFNPDTRTWEKYVDDPVFDAMNRLIAENAQLCEENKQLKDLAVKATEDLHAVLTQRAITDLE